MSDEKSEDLAKTWTTVCKAGGKSKTYRTSGETKQEGREKALVMAAADGFVDFPNPVVAHRPVPARFAC